MKQENKNASKPKTNLPKGKIILIASISIIILIIIIVACIISKNRNNGQLNNELQDNSENILVTIDQNIFKLGKQEIAEENRTMLIHSVEELKNYLNNFQGDFSSLLATYTDAYFESQTLSLVYVETPDENTVISVDLLEIKENTLDIGYSFKAKDSAYTDISLVVEGADSSNGYMILVNSDKTLSALYSHEIQ